jgi:nitrate reductase gamma subunit
MSRKFYLIYHFCLIGIGVIAVGFGASFFFRNFVEKNRMFSTTPWDLVICIALLLVVLIGYIVLLFIEHFKGEKDEFSE